MDANAAYRLADAAQLARLDAFELLMIEQPLEHDDLLDHAALQRKLATPICLDESLTGLRQAEQALELGSCRIINMKVGRVGGYSQALPIHALCRERGVPLWCGGMLESGVEVRADGTVAVPRGPGFGFGLDLDYLEACTQAVERMDRAGD